jgi:hypothetical protein
LLNKNRLCASKATTTSKTIVETDSRFLDLLTLLHDFWLDAALGRTDVVVDLCKFNDSCEHLKT